MDILDKEDDFIKNEDVPNEIIMIEQLSHMKETLFMPNTNIIKSKYILDLVRFEYSLILE